MSTCTVEVLDVQEIAEIQIREAVAQAFAQSGALSDEAVDYVSAWILSRLDEGEI